MPSGTADPTPEAWTARLEAWIELLLGRWGFLARELVADEPLAPSWAALAPVLEGLELRGDLRRGMFVAGLRAAQFAPAATVDRLRALRAPAGELVLVGAADPAFVAVTLGGELPGGLPARRSTSHAVLEDGRVVLAAEGNGRRLRLADGTAAGRRRWIDALGGLLDAERRAVRVETIDDLPAARAPLRPLFEAAGYRPDGEALERRRHDPGR